MLSTGAASLSAVPPPRLSSTPSVTPSARSADFGAENAELREKVQKLRRLLRCANDEIGRLRGGMTVEAGAEAGGGALMGAGGVANVVGTGPARTPVTAVRGGAAAQW